MTAELEQEHAELLAALRRVPPAEPAADLEARVRAAATAAPQPAREAPLRRAFDAHAGEAFAQLCALLQGDAWLAERALVAAFVRLDGGSSPALAEVLQHARHAALEVLAKAGGLAADPIGFDERALLLERRGGASLEALARAWSAVPARLRERLLSAGEALLAAREAGAEAASPCSVGRPLLVPAALDLLDEPEAAAYADHLVACAACARWSDTLEDALTLPATALPAPDKTWERIAAERAEPPAARDLGISVSVSCCYCHDRLRPAEAAFCASCLAPHHAECFAAHGRCSAPGCAGVEVIRPAAAAPSRPRRWRWLAGGLGLAGVAAVAALTSEPDGAASLAAAPAGVERTRVAVGHPEPAPELRVVPETLIPGCSQAEVIAALGEPDEETRVGSFWRLSWRRLGASVLLDLGGRRLALASFYGRVRSDAPLDANGNQAMFTRDVVTFSAGAWSWRGLQIGMPAREVVARVGEAISSQTEAGGRFHYLAYDDPRAILVLDAHRDFALVEIHVGGSARPDANGNVQIVATDVGRPLTARQATANALRAARASGALERVLGSRLFVRYANRSPVELFAVHGALADDGSGLDVRIERTRLSRQRWSHERCRVSWDGVLSRLDRLQVDVDQGGVKRWRTTGREGDRLTLSVEHDGSLPYTLQLYVSERDLPAELARFVLAPLSDALLPADWSVSFRSPIESELHRLRPEFGWTATSAAHARSVLVDDWQVLLDPRGAIAIMNQEPDFWRDERPIPLRDQFWIEPISAADYAERAARAPFLSGHAPLALVAGVPTSEADLLRWCVLEVEFRAIGSDAAKAREYQQAALERLIEHRALWALASREVTLDEAELAAVEQAVAATLAADPALSAALVDIGATPDALRERLREERSIAKLIEKHAGADPAAIKAWVTERLAEADVHRMTPR